MAAKLIMTEFEPIDKLNLPQMLAQNRLKYGSRIAMREHDGRKFNEITYDGFYHKVMQAASALRKAGVKPKDKVAILSENRPAWGAVYFASLFLQAVNVPLDAFQKVSEWSYILTSSEATTVVVSSKFYPDIESLVDRIKSLNAVICMDEYDDSVDYLFADDNPTVVEVPSTNIDETAAIIFTSGTTGLAKGVMLSHGNITSDIYGILKIIDMYPDDNFISILPIHHTFECTCGFSVPLSNGSSITYARGLASKQIVEDIKNTKATVLIGVPLVFEKMFAGLTRAISKKPPFTRAVFKTIYNLTKILKKTVNVEAGGRLFNGLRDKAGMSSLRLMVSGGAPMSPDIAEAFNSLGFRLIQGYGLTESSPVLTINPVNKYINNSIGIAIPGAQIKIVDKNKQNIGELIAKGPMVMKGYYKNKKATDEVLKDGWLYTGDLGWVDDDGYYYITGRKKNLIVTPGGKNVYPEEIEFVLNKSPYIMESLVLGQFMKSSGGGEEIKAVIVPDLEYFSDRAIEKEITLNEEYIEKTIKLEVSKQSEQLADYKRVKYVVIRDEDFEKTSTKKIKRYLYKHKSMTVMSPNKRGNRK